MIACNLGEYVSETILSTGNAEAIITQLKKRGACIGLCTGSFDLLHPGHVAYLDEAKQQCEILIVGVADDRLCRRRKSSAKRPIFPYELRAFMVSKIKSVDYVIEDNGSLKIFPLVRPDIYIKGVDYLTHTNPDFERSKELVAKFGGRVHYTKTEKLATSEIIKYIRAMSDDVLR